MWGEKLDRMLTKELIFEDQDRGLRWMFDDVFGPYFSAELNRHLSEGEFNIKAALSEAEMGGMGGMEMGSILDT